LLSVACHHTGPDCDILFINPSDRPGLGMELNPDVVKAHLAVGEKYWA
jgi:hypothetical protein